MSTRQTIVDAIETAMNGVSGVTGVHVWRRVPLGVNQVPAITIYDTDSELIDGTVGFFTHNLTVDIIGWVTGASAATSARTLLAGILAAIGTGNRWGLSDCITQITTSAIDLAQEGDIVAGCRVTLAITYTTAQHTI